MRLAIIGNCQVQSLRVAAALLLDPTEIRVFDYSLPESRESEQREMFADSLHEVDYIFCQTAGLSHTNETALRDRHGGKVVTIANFYFRGLFPDSCYIGDFAHRLDEPTSVHSTVVLDAFRRGMTVAQTVQEAFSAENFERLGLLDAWDSSMREMRRREATGTVDVLAADLLEEACRAYPAFLTMNHPGAVLLTDYLRKVCHHVGLQPRYVNPQSVPDPLATHDTTPIHDEIASHLRLPYRTTQCWKINSLAGRYLTREDFVGACFAVYGEIAAQGLTIHSPTDMVDALRERRDLAYLLDGGVRAPDSRPADAPTSRSIDRDTAATAERIRALQETVAGLVAAMTESQQYIHRIHSYLEVADPKIEQLCHALPNLLAASDAQLAEPPRAGLAALLSARRRKPTIAG